MREEIVRLMRCGFSEKNAAGIYDRYRLRQDWNGLEQFITECELLYSNFKEYVEEDAR